MAIEIERAEPGKIVASRARSRRVSVTGFSRERPRSQQQCVKFRAGASHINVVENFSPAYRVIRSRGCNKSHRERERGIRGERDA